MAGPITTPLTTLLGFQHPIILAGMARVSGGSLAAAVANAGGLSVVGGYQCTPEQLRATIAEMKASFSRPDLPFGVDLALPKIGGSARKTNYDCTGGRLEDLIDITISSGAKIFVSSAGVPSMELIEKLHMAGILVMNMVGHPKHAVKALDAGADIVCAQGTEGRGHVGDIATSILIPAVVDVARRYRPPLLNGSTALVVAGGGILSGRSLASSLMQGSVAVWVSTRFVASVEANASSAEKQAILDCSYDDTERTLVLTGRPLRMRSNDYIRSWHARRDEVQRLCDVGIIPYEQDTRTGKPVEIPFAMGQVAGSITDILPAKQIVDDMVKEATVMLRLAGTYLGERSKL